MARKRAIFFHPIFITFLSRRQSQARQWQRWFSAVHRFPLIVYGLLTVIALICTTVMPGFARVTVARAAVDTVAQTSPTTQTTTQTSPELTVQQLEQRARSYYDAGQFSDAVAAFEQAAKLYRQSGHPEQAAESQINQSRALQALGLYDQSIFILQTVLKPPQQPTLLLQDLQVEIQCSEKDGDLNPLRGRLKDLPKALPVSSNNAATTVAALRGLGDALQVTGDLEQSCTILHYSLELAQTRSLTDAIAPTYLSLGNLARTQAIADLRLKNLNAEQAIAQLRKRLRPIYQELQHRRTEAAEQFMKQTATALDYYRRAADQQAANDAAPLIQAQAQLNALSLLLDREEWSKAAATVPPLSARLDSLPQNRSAIEARINLAQSLMQLVDGDAAAQSSDFRLRAAQLLAVARQQASELGNAQDRILCFR